MVSKWFSVFNINNAKLNFNDDLSQIICIIMWVAYIFRHYNQFACKNAIGKAK